jgi:signal transduction histidine kinase
MIPPVQASTQRSLVGAVTSLLTEVAKTTETKFVFQYFDIPATLPVQVSDQTFFIVQEAADNIIKHAHAAYAFVQLYCRDNELIISIEDDGIGFDFVNEKGRGLQILENRVAALRGSVEFSCDYGKGTGIMIVIPLTRLQSV